ncbi:MAG TPA: hypothetical protein VK539_14760 [Myxococcaceae bacterium]|nr:hypothetical protein [Myxococcaceae bacterium]
MPSSQKVNAVFGLISGLVVGAFVAGGLSAVVAYSLMRRTEREVRKGWVLLPVVVAAKPFEPGDKVRFNELAQRQVPEQLLTESVVKTDVAHFLDDQMITAPLSSGDPMYWGLFSSARPGATVPGPRSLGDNTVWEACHAAIIASPTLPRRDRTPEDIRARLTPPEAP